MIWTVLATAVPTFAAVPAGTAYTYQRQPTLGGVPMSDTVDFEFTLWDTADGGDPPTGGTRSGVCSP